MYGLRTLLVILVVLSGLAAACSSDSPTTPTSTDTGQSSQNPGTPAPPSPSNPSEPPAPPDPPSDSDAPKITTQPKSQTIAPGDETTLSVKATGNGSLKYRWYAGSSGQTSSPVDGATADKFTTPKLTKTTRYWVRVSNSSGATDSDTATITIGTSEPPDAAPKITSQPKDKTISSGQTATLSVTATGTSPLTYKWYQGTSGNTSLPIGGATNASYTTPALTSTTRYWVRVSNSAGAVESEDATVTVSAPEGNSAFEDEVFTLVNSRRAAGAMCGSTSYGPAAALVMNSKLRNAARWHSQDMAANNYFSHTSLDGRTFDERIHDAGYAGSGPLGENIAAGQSSPSSVVNGWMGSPGHCRNIMDPAFHAIGVGYAYDADATYRHYWTMTFGGS
jgi:uncharacterized protein YkwD